MTAQAQRKANTTTAATAPQQQQKANATKGNIKTPLDPMVGDGITIKKGNDLMPAKVIKRTPKRLVARECRAVLLNGPACKEADIPNGINAIRSGSQLWHVTDDPMGHEVGFTLRKDGKWTLEGAHHYGAPVIAKKGWEPHFSFEA